MIAGLQVILGYVSVAAPAPAPVAVGPFAVAGAVVDPAPAVASSGAVVSFVVRPPNIRNRIFLLFCGQRDARTGCLEGEIRPDFPMRLLGLAPCLGFAIAGIVMAIAAVLVPLATGGQHEGAALVWAAFALTFAVIWMRAYGTALHEAVANVRTESPRAQLRWHPGLRWGSRPAAPPPPAVPGYQPVVDQCQGSEGRFLKP